MQVSAVSCYIMLRIYLPALKKTHTLGIFMRYMAYNSPSLYYICSLGVINIIDSLEYCNSSQILKATNASTKMHVAVSTKI